MERESSTMAEVMAATGDQGRSIEGQAAERRPYLIAARLADPRIGQFGSLIGRSLIWAMRNNHR